MHTFFYDESEHSRTLTKKTITAENFSENFVACIVGYPNEIREEIEQQYLNFDEIYKKLFTVKDELKSTNITKKKYKSGFASFKKNDLNLVNDLLDIVIDNKLFIYISVFNKFEYLILQLLSNYRNSLIIDADNLRYSISKLVALYRPENVYDAVYRNDNSFINELKIFLEKVYKENEKEDKRPLENQAIEQALIILNEYSSDFVLEWNYSIAFQGFKKYMSEVNVNDYHLVIDKEGAGKTLAAAKSEGIENCGEGKSDEYVGLRIADFIAGITSSLLKSISNSLEYGSTEDTKKLQFIKKDWFTIRSEHLQLYKKLKTVIIDQHKVWDKIYSGKYSDNLIYLICILHYFDSFESINDFRKISGEKHQIRLNSMAVSTLQHEFERMRNKIKIDATKIPDNGTYYNQKGAKCYIDYSKHGMLPIKDEAVVYAVLSVGFFGNFEKACITIMENDTPVCYLLPDELKEWSFNMVALANVGVNPFPAEVEFRKANGTYAIKVL